MNIIDFLQAGGFRFKQATLGKMQAAYFEILKAFVTYLGMPDVGNFIISGCAVVGANITDGMLFIDGELCYFEGGPGTAATKLKKEVTTETLAFRNGSNPSVFRATHAVIDNSGSALSSFVRIPSVKEMVWGNISNIPVDLVHDANYVHTANDFTTALKNKLDGIAAGAQVNVPANWTEANPAVPGYVANKPIDLVHDANYVHTENDFTTALKNKLDGIAAGAQVNVPANWTETNPSAPGFIVNKPAGKPLTFLHRGNYTFNDFSADANLTVTFSDVGTASYMVVGSLVSIGSDWNDDNDILFTIKDKTATSFHLLLREVAGRIQYSSFDYMLIPF
jgi:hypothetical protein